MPRAPEVADQPVSKSLVASPSLVDGGKLQPARVPPRRRARSAAAPAPQRKADAASQARAGVMLAFRVHPEVAGPLAVEGGVPHEDMHLTLAYLGKRAELCEGGAEELREIAAGFAKSRAPLAGTVGGIGRFEATGTSDSKDVLYASVDAPGLPEFRQALVEAIRDCSCGDLVKSDHGFTPHVTLAYLEPDAPLPVDKLEKSPIALDTLVLALGEEEHVFPLEGTLAQSTIAAKVLASPTGAEHQGEFVSRCMGDAKMRSEFPDERRRAAVCHDQWREKSFLTDEGGVAALQEDEVEKCGHDYSDPYEVGSVVRVRPGREHQRDHADSAGVVADRVDGALAVWFGGAKEPHRWYVRAELEPAPPDEAAETIAKRRYSAEQRAEMAGDGRAMPDGSFPIGDVADLKNAIAAFGRAQDEEAAARHIARRARALRATELLPEDGPLADLVEKSGEAWWSFELRCPILKADAEQRLVTGIVLQPDVVDAQGDVISAESISAAAHLFLRDYNAATRMGHQHKEFPGGLHLVESWVAPVDLELAGKEIRKGTWIATAHVANDDLWAKVKAGAIRGFSIGGVAKVQRLRAT